MAPSRTPHTRGGCTIDDMTSGTGMTMAQASHASARIAQRRPQMRIGITTYLKSFRPGNVSSAEADASCKDIINSLAVSVDATSSR